MQIIRARQALLASGWANDVEIAIADDGTIASIAPRTPNGSNSADVCSIGVLLPAPANAHSHAFQRAMAGLTERRSPAAEDSFWTWRERMYGFLDRLEPDDVEAITAFVQMQMLEAGYAADVEFHYLHHQRNGFPYANPGEMAARIAAASDQSGIGLTLLPVLYRYSGCGARALGPRQRRFGNDIDRFAKLHASSAGALAELPADARLGVAAHSLRAVAPADLGKLEHFAGDVPIHMHIAEQQAEVEEVEAHLGARPVSWFLANCDTERPWCLVHCTQMTAVETRALAHCGVVAGLCPITESNLGDGIFNATEWCASQGRLAIGSDSNIRIALAEELRTLEYSQRLRVRARAVLASQEHSTGRYLFDRATRGGALAAGRASGCIAAGRLADLMALDDTAIDLADRHGDELLDAYLFCADDNAVTDVWSAGRHRVQAGRHVEHDRISARYRRVMRDLLSALP